ncbi:hypothetical protein BC828DRAFT_406348 [Blastocladiella britannica]|nr:hypothetical protein BC828DRAFT_406348 [Blastocladiella britannica]
MDKLLPDKLLVRVSTYLDLSAILAFRGASRCLVNLTHIMLKHDPATRALMAIVGNGTAEGADEILRTSKDESRERLIVPLGSIPWVMALMHRDELGFYDFGAQILHQLVNSDGIDPEDLIETPGCLSGLARLLSRASACNGMKMDSLWDAVDMAISAMPMYMHNIAESGFLQNMTSKCGAELSDDYDVSGAAEAVEGFCRRASTADLLDDFAPDIVTAAAALCHVPDRQRPYALFSMICQIFDPPTTSVARLFLDRMDLPVLYVRFFAFPDTDDDLSAHTHALALHMQALPDAGVWTRTLTIYACTPEHLVVPLFYVITKHLFGSPEFVALMGDPPTWQWCLDMVAVQTHYSPLGPEKLDHLRHNLAEWASDDLEAKIDGLHGGALTEPRAVFGQANMWLAISAMESVVRPASHRDSRVRELLQLMDWILGAVERTCQQYLKRSSSWHTEGACARCIEMIARFC